MNPHYYDESWIETDHSVTDTDICVYGGTAAGIAAGVAATELGKSVVVLHPGRELGGMTTGGLGLTDLGNKAAIGGIARRFYRLLGTLYAGRFGKGEEVWTFEPSVATAGLSKLIQDAGLAVRTGCYLESIGRGDGGRITEIRMRGGRTARARQFIDATYEGDLMAAAGVPFTIGRESNSAYGETLDGLQLHPTHQFDDPVSPFSDPDDPSSGLLPGILPGSKTPRFVTSDDVVRLIGSADHRIQAYNFRVCMTTDPQNLIPFPKPPGYDAARYELAARWIDTLADPMKVFRKFDMVTPTKTDTNNHGAFSTDFIGGSWEWPDADYERREALFQEHVRYQQGLHYFLANDSRVRDEVRREYSKWGLASDEFATTGGWPHQLYVREGRRMIGDYVVTEQDCLSKHVAEDPVGMGAYNMDSHNCERFIVDGMIKNEGDVQVPLPKPYGISLRAILPPTGSCPNLTVPVAVSASHIAFGSVRMEPVFMILAESAATVASLAIDSQAPVQALPYEKLRPILDKRGQVLSSDTTNIAGEANPSG